MWHSTEASNPSEQLPGNGLPVAIEGIEPLTRAQKVVQLASGRHFLKANGDNRQLALEGQVQLSWNVNRRVR